MKVTGSQAMDRLEHLVQCQEMGGGRNDGDDERELRQLVVILDAVGGRDGMEAIEALDQCPACGHAIARIAGPGHIQPRTCRDCWRRDSSLEGRWSGGGTARVNI